MKVIAIIIFLCFFSAFSLQAAVCDLGTPLKVFKPTYAKNFRIEYFLHFKIVHSGNDKYLLSNKAVDCQFKATTVMTPVKRVVMMSTTYLPALLLLKVEKSLIAFQGKRYIVSTAFDLKNIKEVSFKINPEDLLGLGADLIMGYDSNLSNPKQETVFKSLKLPVVLNKDFEELNPLGRAEWLIFIASFYNREDEAQKIFKSISHDYLALKEENLKLSPKPRVLIGEIQNGFWVTSGGLSDQAQMVGDAGGDMQLNRPSPAMQKISLEELSQVKMPVDFWFPQNMWSGHADLVAALKKDSRYSLISAKNIYNNNLIHNKDGFNDFWETGMQRPDLMLLDLSALFYPEKHPGHKLKWYQKI